MGHSKRLRADRADPEDCAEYRKYRQMGEEICQRLDEACREKQPISAAPEGDTVTNEAEQVTSAADRWTCPACGGPSTGKFLPNSSGLSAPDHCPQGAAGNHATLWEKQGINRK